MRGWCLLLILWPMIAHGHQQSTSYGSWLLQDAEARFVLRISQLDLTRARLHPQQDDYQEALHAYVRTHVTLQRGTAACQADAVRSEAAESGWLRIRMHWQCPNPTGMLAIRFSALFAQAPNHVHLAAIRMADGTLHSRVFSAGREIWQPGSQSQQVADGFLSYLQLGVAHILEGWDHLCFVLVLILFVRRWQTLAWLVTGFTLGHSATLALATLGLAMPAARAVEWIIAFSILALAIENVWRQEQFRGLWPYLLLGLFGIAGVAGGALPLLTALGLCLFLFGYLALQRAPQPPPALGLLVTVAFGLFHGFGFAGALGELSIPDDQLLVALLAFNLGVEAGQLMAIALVLLPLRWLQQGKPQWLNVPNALVSAAACYWLVQRSIS